MNEVGIDLVWCAVQVTSVAVVASALYLLVRRIGPAAGSWAVITSLLVIAVLSALAFSPWPNWPTMLSAASSEPSEAKTPQGVTHAVASGSSGEASEEGPQSELVDGPSDLPERSLATPIAALWQALADGLSAASSASQAPRRWTRIVTMLFFIAMGMGFLWVLAGLVVIGSYRLRSRRVCEADLLEQVDLLKAELDCRRPIELREADGLVMAATFGWRRPVILLPPEWPHWTQAERRAVLAHEVAHIRHNDFLACLCGQVSLVLHFYHPLVHWLAGRLRLEQELAADATAAALAGGKGAYLKTLTEIALSQEDRFVGWPVRTFLPTRNTFLRRIQMLRYSKPSTTSLSARARALTVGVLVLLGLTVVGLRAPLRDAAALAEQTQTDAAKAAQAAQGQQTQADTAQADTAKAAQETQPILTKDQLISAKNLKLIVLAMHHYHDKNKRFLPAASYDADGKPLLSWRVHLLPFMLQDYVYEQFHLDEPWDSPHNIKLLPKMPVVYRAPGETKSGEFFSAYYVLTGRDTVFAGKKGIRIIDIQHGTANTIMFVEARRSIPWTKPEDIPYAQGRRMPRLGGFNKDSYCVALCEGSVLKLRHSVAEGQLRALIEKFNRLQIRLDYRALGYGAPDALGNSLKR